MAKQTGLWSSVGRWLNSGITLEESIAAESRNNFKLIRLTAALVVVAAHGRSMVLHQVNFDQNPQLDVLFLGIPTFFFLSGLLVAQSLERSSTWKQFAWKRVLRLYPAACLAILSCALIMGPLLTTCSPKSYFLSPTLYQYLSNCFLVRIYYRLPGVFEHSRTGSDGVNNSLWSLALEWKLYAGLLLVWVLRIPFKRILLICLIAGTVLAGTFFYEPVSETIRNVTGREFLLYPYVTFVPLFLIGVWCNLKKKTLVIRNGWILILTIGLVITLYLQVFRPFSFILLPGFILYAAARGTKWAGKITPVPDLSYGIYVFAYPIQQLIGNYIRPENSWLMFLLSVGLVLPFALFSWYMVEKKALGLKGLVR